MLRRHLLSVARGLVLFGVAVAALVLSVLGIVAATLVVPYPLAARAVRGLSNLSRRLAHDWSAVAIEVPPPIDVPEPRRREDGWYVHDNQLYKHRTMPAFLLRIQALSKDQYFGREWGWMFTDIVAGGLVAALPTALVVVGALAVAGVFGFPGAVAVAVGVASILLGVAVAPLAVRLNALWTRTMLQPSDRSWWHRSGIGPWVGRRSAATWHSAGLVGLSFAAFGAALLTVAAIVVSFGGLLPLVSPLSRQLVGLYRTYARKWTDEELPTPYLPAPPPPLRGSDGSYQVGRVLYAERAAAIRAARHGGVLRDPATWRDLLWSAGAPLFAVPGLIPATLVSVGFFGLVWQALWWAPWGVPIGLFTGYWVSPFYLWQGAGLLAPNLAAVPDWVSVFIGLAVSGVGLLLAIPVLRMREWWDRLLLTPTRSARLAQRVVDLTESRAHAADAQAAELRRIERDLHDGAQARLVSVGLSLAAIEALMETDPARARALLAQARESSATALTELRSLVRGIHPPVLAERGLGEAVRAVALDTPLPVAVAVDLPGRVESPVETAAYFGVCEALANAARHADATRVDVDIRYHDGLLTVTVTDDGRGGAEPTTGSGLDGVRRRLATFDGVLDIASPPGGPTVVTMEVPCALSSPKTSTS
ncbi:sensor histidine kinase [Rugosimonospora africana]|uniref:histidine kinase n=1 Tax=Rugosimonospora africana TaxID=556532 RepID=A0A8J3QZX9_9ACTN|nr:histidine kinase [Rugosimonospora africana]GIH19267.1 histidine kinase [Rugosimonospora africana]